MSEMTFGGEERDNFREHEFHKTYDKDCSTCFSENVRVEKSAEDYLKMTKNPYGSNYPTGYIPE